jgi:hypothetical protein
LNNLTQQLRSIRALCPSLDGITDDRVTNMLAVISDLHPELSIANYGSSLNEAIVMMAAHRLASEQQYLLGSQVSIAEGKIVYPNGDDWLHSTPYGQRVCALRCQSVSGGAVSIAPERLGIEWSGAIVRSNFDFGWYD